MTVESTSESTSTQSGLLTVNQTAGVPQTKLAPSRRPSAGAPPRPIVSNPVAATTKVSKKKKQPSVTMATAPNGSTGAQGENTGRWTAEEHRLFLQGLEQHGKGWKKIASLIKSRTVVQIRTHAQKYFQKLAKARQNGEEGDVTMEGRGTSVGSVGTPNIVAQSNKRRRQITGTKRKAIQSVVSSAIRQGKKMALAQAAAGVPNPVPPLPAAAPALAHFVLPQPANGLSSSTNQAPASAYEESLFRFLTPVSAAPTDAQVSDVARQAGANPITVPSSNPSTAPSTGGEISPTGVNDMTMYPSWSDAKDPPSWYAKGADVDALLDVADSLDWLADTGDPNEIYQAPTDEDGARMKNELGTGVNSSSVTTLPHVDSNVEAVVPPLPALFEGGSSDRAVNVKTEEKPPLPDETANPEPISSRSTHPDINHLEVFDTPMDEHDFVSTILENKSQENLEELAS